MSACIFSAESQAIDFLPRDTLPAMYHPRTPISCKRADEADTSALWSMIKREPVREGLVETHRSS